MRRSVHGPGSASDNDDNNEENRDHLPPLASLHRFRKSPKKSMSRVSVASRQTTDTEDVFNSGLLTPPSSQIMDDDNDTPPRRAVRRTPTSQSMSRRTHEASPSTSTSRVSAQAAKRKRNSIFPSSSTSTNNAHNAISNDLNASATEISTPNPKPRKQSRRQSSAQTGSASPSRPRLLLASASTSRLRSPSPKKTSSACTCGSPVKRILYNSSHATNVNADYFPPSECPSRKCRMRGHSTTPAYEPPRERFTPPREIEVSPLVFDTPRAPKSTRRNASARMRRSSPVKSEPPEIDLSQALRPPSPTDDPLLLSDGRSTKSPPLRSRVTPAFSSSPSDNSQFIDPPLSFAARLSGGRVDDFGSTDDSDVLPVFSLPNQADQTSDGWSDSEDEFNLTGEYTGKYKVVKVPTKADPPTSGTRERMESWGRPRSPFPYSEIMERSLPLSDFTDEEDIAAAPDFDELEADPIPPFDDQPIADLATDPPPSDDIWSSSSEFAEYDEDLPAFEAAFTVAEPAKVRSIAPSSLESPTDPDQTVLLQEEEEEEKQVDRELSVPVEQAVLLPETLDSSGMGEAPEEASSDEDVEVDSDIIKITSGDAKAAARAAAILRMHDYDCVLTASKSRRSSRSSASTRKRRTTIGNAGVAKPYSDRKVQRRQTIHGKQISLPGGAPLLELWRDAEDSVFIDHHTPGKTHCESSFSFSPSKTTTPRPARVSVPPSGKWSREDWKRMDKCMVAERLAVAAASGHGADLLADINAISKEAVLGRFISQVGGDAVLRDLGPEWARENLMMRLEILIKKQLRFANKGPSFHLQDEMNTSLDSTVPRYHNLLQEARAISSTAGPSLNRLPNPPHPDSTVDQEDLWSRGSPEPVSCPVSDWASQPRGPIMTPARLPKSKAQHPKDQVHLRHASLPKKSMIPVLARPKRLIDLRHLSPSKLTQKDSMKQLRPRRSSGCSVRDLVRCFENMDG
ncbi:hypothetical protein HYDPIDRAFT_112668 [Hydnomerulius pinastri MD-312]|uniref:Uncharacterized protein n=1 Tax=Hydnomerulius pinastri MD-312 TaxID=994086 RepID=A0A0C9WE95_9AGAM|nr:hypothetical protein HYDPIDRAFT_112668 [Hydnomerulius pinastri MD-312]